MVHILLFMIIVGVVSLTSGLIKPVELGKSLREAAVMFLSTSAGLALAALAVFFLSNKGG